MFYVYTFTNPFKEDQPFYVGKGSGDRAIRHLKSAHWNSSEHRDRNEHKKNTIKQIVKDGGEVGIVYEYFETEQEAFTREEQLISEYKRAFDGGCLTNLCKGGEGQTRDGVPVTQYNLFGEKQQTFKSLLEAAQSCGTEHSSAIVGCCKKTPVQKSAHGFFWAYAHEKLDTDWCFGSKRPVYQWDLEGNFVNRFTNCSLASRDTNVDSSEISIARRTGKIRGGYYWTFGDGPTLKPRKLLMVNETGELFNTIKRAGEVISKRSGLSPRSAASNISAALRGDINSYAGYTYEWIDYCP